MNENSRIFDFLQNQLDKFPKADMLNCKVNGEWVASSTQQVKDTVDQLSAGLLSMGIGGHDMTVEKQDKIALISKNRPEWIILDLACQQIGALLCPIYPTTNINELEFIFNDATIKLAFVSGTDILTKVETIKSRVPTLENIFAFDETEGAIFWKEILAAATAADDVRNERRERGLLMWEDTPKILGTK